MSVFHNSALIGAAGAGTGAAAAAEYVIPKSLRFNSGDSAHLSRTPSSAGNRKRWTWSGWVKRSKSGHSDFFSAVQDTNNATIIQFDNSDRLDFEDYQTSNVGRKITTQVFRDFSAWYHIVAVYDSNNATADDRIILYVNGSRVTAFDTSSNPSSWQDSIVNSANAHYVGVDKGFSNHYFNGYLADVHFIDGQALQASDFGETRSSDGVWVPKEFTGTFSSDPVTIQVGSPSYPSDFTTTGNKTSDQTGLSFGSWSGTYTGANTKIFKASDDSVFSILVDTTGRNDDRLLWYSDNLTDWTYIGNGNAFSPPYTLSGHKYYCTSEGAGDVTLHVSNPTFNSFHLNFSDSSTIEALGFDSAPTTSDPDPKKGFDVITYTGNGSTQNIGGLGFEPDLMWSKTRSNATDHKLVDSIRGVTNVLEPNQNRADSTGITNGITTINPDGFAVGNSGDFNYNGRTFVTWCWRAGGPAVTNTDGSIDAEVSANTDYGFSIAKYTVGNNTSQTIGHGLTNQTPKFIIVKETNQVNNWQVYHASAGNTKYLYLNSNAGAATNNLWDNTSPTTSVFTIRSGGSANFYDGKTQVAYIWSEVSGFSKFGSYTGNGSSDGPSVDTGFKPKWIMIKRDGEGDWRIWDTERDPSNPADNKLYPNKSDAETGSSDTNEIDILSNGFQLKSSASEGNNSGDTYIYAAFADRPGNHFDVNNIVTNEGLTTSKSQFDIVSYTGTDSTQKLGGPTYSDAVPTADGFRPGRAAADGFDGSLSTYVALNNYTFNLDVGSWGLSGTLEVYTGANMQYAVDGGSASSMTADGWTNVGNANAITTLTFTRTDGAYPYFYAIRLDGEYLIDGDGGPALQFQPDLVWVKNRDQTEKHVLVDSVRGVDKALYSSSASAEDSGSTYSDRFVSFNSDGFNVGSTHTTTNSDGDDFAAWSWSAGPNSNKTYTVKVVSDSGNKYRFDDFGSSAVTLDLQEGSTYIFDQSDSSNSGHPIRFGTSANGTDYTTGVTHTGTPGSAGAKTTLVLGTGVATLYYSCANHSGMGGQINTNSTAGASNFDGSIQAVVKASDTHGFSIMRYLGNATSNATVGHGLSKAPEWIIGKNRGGGDAWWVWFKAHSSNASKFLRLNLTNTESDTQYIANDTAPSSSVVTLGSDYGWNSNQSPGMIMYAWTSVSGYSKFGTYTGASNLEITTGFKVQWLLLKSYAGDGFNWVIIDNARAANSSGVSKKLYPNLNGSEDSDSRASETKVEFTDTGFKFLDTGAETNSSSRSYVYAAFAGKPPSNIIDSMVDSPSNYAADSGHNGGNYPTVNRVAAANISSTEEGNLKVTTQSSNYGPVVTTMATSGSGKWYAEITWNSGTHSEFGLVPASSKIVGQGHLHDLANSYVLDSYAGGIRFNGGSNASSASVSSGDVVRIAFDESASQVEFFVNGASVGTLTASSSTAGVPYVFGVSDRDSGSASTYTFNFGASGSFDFDPPIGYSNLCTQNLPDPTIADGSAHFEAKTFTGTGSSQTISGLQFSPDFVWIKNRADSSAAEHRLLDTVRGATKVLYSNLTNSESAESQSLTAFTSDGFTVGTGNYVNGSGDGMIAWAWDAGSSTAVNQDGDINSNVRVNASAGCSIVTFSTGLDGVKAIGHGLNATPTFVITKQRNATSNWIVYHEGGTGYDQIIRLNLNSGLVSLSSAWGSASNWSNATFGINTSTNQTGDVVAYCFAPVTGFSSFGTYEGNGSNDGPAVILSFRPSWVMIKRLGEGDWRIWDTSRDPSNFADNKLYPNKTDAETGSSDTNEIDILSNGFKLRSSASEGNASSNTYIYAAFAEHPFKTARAR